MACISASTRFSETFGYSMPLKFDYSLQPLTMVAASLYLPKDDPEKPLGEDAHFIFTEQGKTTTFGIADGVGGWAKTGVDAGEYTRELMSNAVIAVQSERGSDADPKRVLEQAFLNTKSQGSSTACVVTLAENNILRAVNVGDSGFYVIRGGRVVYTSPVQQRSFNCPYQLGIGKDNPNVAQEIEIPMEKGDVIVAGTDGFFDNMEIDEIEDIVRRLGPHQPKKVALRLGNIALYNSFDRYRETPFSRAARKAGLSWRGGKVDDITVIVAYLH